VGFTQQWSLTSTVDARTQGSGGHCASGGPGGRNGRTGGLLILQYMDADNLLILQYMDADKKNVGLSPTQQNIALA
jgi:hypothetical protein